MHLIHCLINLESDVEVISQLIASLIGPQNSFSREPYWDEQARSILAGVLAAVMTYSDPIKRNMTEVCKLLFADDTIYTLATLLDTRKDLPKMTYQNISSLLQTVEVTRSGILSTTQSYLKSFNVSRILKTLDTSSFSLEDFQNGISTTIYINIPPAYLKSHAAYVKLIMGTLMHSITTRKTIPVLPPVFVLDEASSLGSFDQLSSMIPLGRGFGCITHTLWQDLSQIKKCYPDWENVINNSPLQIFGVGSHLAARTLSEVIGIHPEIILNLTKDQQILVMEGNIQLCEKLNYLNDSYFKGKYDQHPLINRAFP
ncbi:hypothetical protein FDK13_34270 [Dyadobacter frigoris]|uniref:Type IV secretory system conjugative DNA transfer family protein n=2 Tax=Dyadobacter frigoris TaxID=2576211 RepID=A0A4U6CLV0_9BACT|nr:hypothetical protein FDK13_34270 [Dyadobacter frigoris]